jgi:hypothetical protein
MKPATFIEVAPAQVARVMIPPATLSVIPEELPLGIIDGENPSLPATFSLIQGGSPSQALDLGVTVISGNL